MNQNTIEIIIKVFIAILGLYCFVNYKSLGAWGAYQQQKILKSVGIHVIFGEKSVKGFQYGALIFGILLIVSALLSLK